MTIKPIETWYAGCLFRSRLEARWAVFFDALSIRWEYEPQGFELTDGRRYLPDFWLPDMSAWCGDSECIASHGEGIHVEVKGDDDQVTDAQRGTMTDLVERGPLHSGLLLLGSIPRSDIAHTEIVHALITLYYRRAVKFEHFGSPVITGSELNTFAQGEWPGPELGLSPTEWASSLTWRPLVLRASVLRSTEYSSWQSSDRVSRAYTAARSARFEHGQSGAVR